MPIYPPFPTLSRLPSLKGSETPLDPTLRDPMENGMESTRARWTRVRRTFSVTIDLLPYSDKRTLDAFYQITLQYGALPFVYTDVRDLENPQNYTVRFSTLPHYTDAGFIQNDGTNPANYRQNCTFEIREV